MVLKGGGALYVPSQSKRALAGPTDAHPLLWVAGLGKLTPSCLREQTDALMLLDALRTRSEMTNIIVYSHSRPCGKLPHTIRHRLPDIVFESRKD
ncbi:hypothetical protein C8R31_10616 [Nitrosospira sp. Nsp2]|nr:hypothetical protein C8R31_10616 [Nitrosospira sp. Nsp2]